MNELTGNLARDRLIADRENAPWGEPIQAPDSIPTLTTRHMINDDKPLDERMREAAQGIEDIVDAGRQKLEQAGEKLESRIDARLEDLDARGTKEINRWGGKEWGQAIAGLAAVIVLSFVAGRAGADDAQANSAADDIGPPNYGCPTGWVDSETGERFDVLAYLAMDPKPAVTIDCPNEAQDGADALSDDG